MNLLKKTPLGERLRDLRLGKNLSQGDIEDRTGLLRCYVSRVENGFTIPALETLEKFARALEMPLYQIFYEGEGKPPTLKIKASNGERLFGERGASAKELGSFRRAFAKMTEGDRKLLLHTATKMASLGLNDK